MFDQIYRQRLEADLSRWQADGVITAETGNAIRRALGPAPAGIGVATIVSIVGGLLIAAAFLAFVAANWSEIPRPARLGILLAGLAAAHGIGALFAVQGRAPLADLAAAVGALIFGASIALVGQMYHLPSDFAAGLLLWAAGAFVGALLTGSRGALAVALAVGCAWTIVSTTDLNLVPHWPFLILWAGAAALAVIWNAGSARHLVAISLIVWWSFTTLAFAEDVWFSRVLQPTDPIFMAVAGAALMFGSGLAMQAIGPATTRLLGRTFATYGAFGLAGALVVATLAVTSERTLHGLSGWVLICAITGIALAGFGAIQTQRIGTSLAVFSILAGLLVALTVSEPITPASRWLAYALSLSSALCLIISGTLDMNRPRLVAGWIGLAIIIATITWTVKGALLTRALFLGISGGTAIVLAFLLGRLSPKEAAS